MKSPFGPGTPEGTRVDAGPGRGEVMIREAGGQTGHFFFSRTQKKNTWTCKCASKMALVTENRPQRWMKSNASCSRMKHLSPFALWNWRRALKSRSIWYLHVVPVICSVCVRVLGSFKLSTSVSQMEKTNKQTKSLVWSMDWRKMTFFFVLKWINNNNNNNNNKKNLTFSTLR